MELGVIILLGAVFLIDFISLAGAAIAAFLITRR